MRSSELRTRLLALIGLSQASDELQEGFLHAFERITMRRLGGIVARKLSDEQIERVRTMRQAGASDDSVIAWIRSQMRVSPPSYDDLYETVMLAVLREVEIVQSRRGAWGKQE